MPSFPFFHKIMGFAGACQPLRGTGDDAFLPHILFKEPVPEERETEKGLRPRDNVVACAGKGNPMTLPVKILSVLAGLSLAGSARARIWTNDRGATVVAVLVAVRDAEVDLKLQDGRVVAVPKNIFSGADQEYILEWVKAGGTLPDTDVGAENPPVQGDSGRRYVPLEPNWDAPWPERVVVPGFLLVKTVQETEELSVYETDHFIMESPGKLPEAERMILARRFETILSALAAVPLNLAVARRPSRKYLVRVCFQEEDFNRAPGLRNGHLKFSPTSFTALLLRDKKGKLLKPGHALGGAVHGLGSLAGGRLFRVHGFSSHGEGSAGIPEDSGKAGRDGSARRPHGQRSSAGPGGHAVQGFSTFRRGAWRFLQGRNASVLGRFVVDGLLEPPGRERKGGAPQKLFEGS